MLNIQFKRLTEVNKTDIIELMNNQLVRRQMPLLTGDFSERDCDRFITAKEQLWQEYGYGPWAFIVDGQFAGWGGLQPENGAPDLALVLHPNFWGIGKTLYKRIIDQAFGAMGFDTISILFPPSRTRINGLLRLGFKQDKELDILGQRFIRYTLQRTVNQ